MNEDKLVKIIVSQRIIKNSFKKYVLSKTKNSSVHLNNNELMTLFYLKAFPGLTQKEMSEYLDYDLATAGRILESMAKKKIITRVKSRTDARKNDIALTDLGNTLLGNLFKLAQQWYKENAEDLLPNNQEDSNANDRIIKLAKKLTSEWGGTNGWKQI